MVSFVFSHRYVEVFMKHCLMCLLYVAALGVLSFVVGRLIPKHWFHADRFPWVCHPAEQKLWKRLQVRKWQAKIPDRSRIFVKIMPEKKLTKENYENLPRMIEETCVAEWTLSLIHILKATAASHKLRCCRYFCLSRNRGFQKISSTP